MGELAGTLAAISMGAVYMGALTYIGNAPNFMIYAIATERGVKMPSFFGYIVWSVAILLPVFVVLTFAFVTPWPWPWPADLACRLAAAHGGGLAPPRDAAFAGITAMASTSISAPGLASAEIATAVLAGGAAVSTKRSRTSRNTPRWEMSVK